MTAQGMIARKVGMSRFVDSKGQMRAVTILQIEQSKVTKILTEEKNGYHGIQVGYYVKRESLLGKPDVHRLRKANVQDNFSRFKEFRLEKAADGFDLGYELDIDGFEKVKAVDVTGITKGRGFQGATRRWGAKTGRRTHGSRFHRRPGSLGQRTTPGRVFKNKHVPGHMGHVKRTIQNLQVAEFDKKNSVLAIFGAVPGHRNGFVIIKPSLSAKNRE
jgi:large subunit ribosomal protein L3